jgi:hypothetical protein
MCSADFEILPVCISTDRLTRQRKRESFCFFWKRCRKSKDEWFQRTWRRIKFSVILWASEKVIKTYLQAYLRNLYFLKECFCVARYRQLLRHVCEAGCFTGVRRRATFLPFALTRRSAVQVATKYTPATNQLVPTCRSRDFLVAKIAITNT